jgi:hypothetical protein
MLPAAVRVGRFGRILRTTLPDETSPHDDRPILILSDIKTATFVASYLERDRPHSGFSRLNARTFA